MLIALLFWDPWHGHGSAAKRPLFLYCAAGIRPPVEEAAGDYQRQYGVEVQVLYGGSQTLLANIEASKRGDLYLPADESYINLTRAKGLVKESLPLAHMTPVLAVPKGNPKSLHSLDDLNRAGVHIAQANPEAAAVGKVTKAGDESRPMGRIGKEYRRYQADRERRGQRHRDRRRGPGFVWDATVRQTPQLEAVNLPEFADVHALVAVGVLTTSEQPTAALRFARYLAARDKGLPLFQRDGYEPVEGDPWAETPELRIFSGAMLRPAIDDTIDEFEKREGVRVARL